MINKQNIIRPLETVKGITWDKGFYYLRGGATGLRESAKNETTWIKQFASINIV